MSSDTGIVDVQDKGICGIKPIRGATIMQS